MRHAVNPVVELLTITVAALSHAADHHSVSRLKRRNVSTALPLAGIWNDMTKIHQGN